MPKPVPTRQMTEDNEEEEDDDDGDTQGRTMTAVGMEVCLTSNDEICFITFIFFLYIFYLSKIERASAGNVKLNSAEKSSDPEQPDDFGYTQSKLFFNYLFLNLK